MATKYTFYFSDPSKADFSLYPYTANGPVSPSDPTFIDQAVTATTTLKLYGKGMQNYGEGIEQNLIYMLENFANSTPPVNAIEGQIWYRNVGLGSPSHGPELFINNGSGTGTMSDWDAIILSTGSSKMTGELILAGVPTNPNAAVPLQYIDDHINGNLTGYNLHITSQERTFLDGLDLNILTPTEVMFLDGVNSSIQPQIDDKLSRQGDSLNAGATLTLNGGDLILLGSSSVQLNGGEIFGLPAVPTVNDAAASKAYVDAQIIAGGADGTIDNIFWAPNTDIPPYVPNVNETDLNIVVKYPDSTTAVFTAKGVSRIGHQHLASKILFDNPGSPSLDIYGSTVQAIIEDIDKVKANKVSPTITGGMNITGVVNLTGSINASGGATFSGPVSGPDPVSSTDFATKNYVDNIAGGGGGGSTVPTQVQIVRNLEIITTQLDTSTPYEVPAHIAGDNKLSIYVNGIKQASDTRGLQRISYDNNVQPIANDAYTGLDSTQTYEFNISVDGAAPITITIPPGSSIMTHGALMLTINDIMTGGSPNLADAAVYIESDDTETFISLSSGNISSISISDPGTPGNIYLFDTGPTPINIDGANFISDISSTTGTPDEIMIFGDVTATFPVGKTFTIRGSYDPTYGSFDGVYSVHVNGSYYVTGSPGYTVIPIGWVADPNINVPLLGSYIPGAGSPPAAYPSPTSYGSIYLTPLGGFIGLNTPIQGVDGDYRETDMLGNTLPSGEFTGYVVFRYTIPANNRIESILLI